MDIHRIHVGDTRLPLGFTIERDGAPVDLTGKTLKFKLIRANGTTKVALTDQNIVATAAADGEGQYNWQTDDVSEGGTFYAYVLVFDAPAGPFEHFPVAHRQLRVDIDAD